MDEKVKVKSIIVFESDYVEYANLVKDFIESLDLEVILNKSVVEEKN